MKHLILLVIKLYWFAKPKNSKPKCIFKTSCSHYVFETTKKYGFLKGLNAFLFRINNCNGKSEMFINPLTKEINMILSSKTILEEREIAERLIKNL